MCSHQDGDGAGAGDGRSLSAQELVALVQRAVEAHRVVARAIADPASDAELGGLHPDVLAELTVGLLRSADAASAAATVLAARVAAGTGPRGGGLIEGRFASPRRWLQARAGLSGTSASAVLARGRDLNGHSARVAEAWLAGQVTGDAVRVLTLGVSGALKRVAASSGERDALRAEALEVLVPLAGEVEVDQLTRVVGRLRLAADPDGASQAAMDAYDDQSLTVTPVGAMTRLEAWLTHENAAAVMTVVDRRARAIAEATDRDLSHEPDCPAGRGEEDRCACGAQAHAGAMRIQRWSHLAAVAFAEVMTGLLDDAQVGSHHRVAPHVSVTVDLADYLGAGGPLLGELAMPGRDAPLLVPDATVQRILCDAQITTVLTTPVPERPTNVGMLGGDDRGVSDQDPCDVPEASGLRAAIRRVRAAGREVLWAGRAERSAPPRLRRALEARDRHCVFPGCRAHPRRCHAHHVEHWESGGGSDLDNMLLLCLAHHHAVHEGGWRIRPVPGAPPGATDRWRVIPPGADPPARPGDARLRHPRP